MIKEHNMGTFTPHKKNVAIVKILDCTLVNATRFMKESKSIAELVVIAKIECCLFVGYNGYK